ncbi:MAG: hypothetical protein N2560_01535 [Ignavibacteria bacterium]|nr:hypothetical protein [Ignavibacteria bacterium]
MSKFFYLFFSFFFFSNINAYCLKPIDYVVIPKIEILKLNSYQRVKIEFDKKYEKGTLIVKRKKLFEDDWQKIDTVPPKNSIYSDTLNQKDYFEYGFFYFSDTLNAFGYYIIGNKEEIETYQGNILILIDSTIAESIANDFQMFTSDLVSDGWYVETRKVPRCEGFNPIEVNKVKRIVNSFKRRWKDKFKVLLIVGRVPVPYTGNYTFDGHSDHFGAFPSDLVYVVDDSLLTDEIEYNLTATREENWNVPFDYKFDQITLPKNISIAIGRIDFSNLNFFNSNEKELLSNYFKKNHLFRIGKTKINLCGLIDDGFGTQSDEIFSSNAWMNFFPICDSIVEGNMLNHVNKNYYHFSYACNSGSYTSVWSSINSEDCARNNIFSTFVFLFGSYFWDWDTKNNLLRSVVASSPNVLLASWIGRPFWHFHHLAFGLPFYWSYIATANNQSLYQTTGKYGYKGMHIETIGDPTLRIVYPKPIDSLEVFTHPSRKICIKWLNNNIQDNLIGYQISRKRNNEFPFKEIAFVGKEMETFCEDFPGPGTYLYQVNAIYLIKNKFGTYFARSIGIIREVEIK